MTARIREFLKRRTDEGPCLVVDLDVVRENYHSFAKALPDSKVFYAVKANPAPEILKLLVELGACFDVASVGETEMVLAAGATPDRISYGNTIKKESEIAAAFALGVHAVRRRLRGRGREGRPRRARLARDLPHPLRQRRRRLAAVAQVRLRAGLCRRHPGARAPAGPRAARHLVPRRLPAEQRGGLGPRARLDGGDLPHLRRARHQPVDGQSRRRLPGQVHPQDAEARSPTARRSSARCASISATRIPNTIVEPGRGLVGNAGIIEAEVVLIAKRNPEDEVRWVYLDIGKFHGLAETIDESIRYPIRTPRDRDEMAPCVVAGPTCDSVDVLYEKNPYPLPVSLAIGDKVLIEATGAYTTTYSSVGFNGYPPLRQYVI